MRRTEEIEERKVLGGWVKGTAGKENRHLSEGKEIDRSQGRRIYIN